MDDETRSALAEADIRIAVLEGLVAMLIGQTSATDLTVRRRIRMALEALQPTLAAGSRDLAVVDRQLAQIPR